MKRNGAFDTVIKANKDYVRSVDNNERKEIQENLLATAKVLFQTMVAEPKLHTEYREYCEWLRFHGEF